MKKRLSNRLMDHFLGLFRCDNRIGRGLDSGQVHADSAAPIALGGPLDLWRNHELPDLAPTEALLAPHEGSPLPLAVFADHADLVPIGHDPLVATGAATGGAIGQRPAFALASWASLKDRLLDELVPLARSDAVRAGPLDDGGDLEVPFFRDLSADVKPHEAVSRLDDFREERFVLPDEGCLERFHYAFVRDLVLIETKKQHIFVQQRCLHALFSLLLVG